jgi:hypothetical protein
MKKILIAAVIIWSAGGAHGAEFSDLRVSAAGLAGAAGAPGLEAPQPEPAAVESVPGTAPSTEDQVVLGALGETEWQEVFSRGSEPADRELFSDFNTRYLVRGNLTFRTSPPTLTSRDGKAFRVRRYPFWLRLLGDREICAEGYVRQQDDTDEIVIARLLPREALDSVTPSQGVLEMYKTATLAAGQGGSLVLGNVAWNLRHNQDGSRVRNEHGNFITDWRSGVRVRPELLLEAYFVKKSSTGRPRYGNHGLLMFKFDRGGVTLPGGGEAAGLAVSLDAYYKSVDVASYSQADGLRGKYMVYYSVSSLERYIEAKTAEGKDQVFLYPLVLSPAQSRRLLTAALNKAAENKLGEMYSLLYNSCTNAAVSLINSVLEDGRKLRDGWLPELYYRIGVTVPDTAAGVLLRRGITRPAPGPVDVSNFDQYRNL